MSPVHAVRKLFPQVQIVSIRDNVLRVEYQGHLCEVSLGQNPRDAYYNTLGCFKYIIYFANP
jgi:hypothetical protein